MVCRDGCLRLPIEQLRIYLPDNPAPLCVFELASGISYSDALDPKGSVCRPSVYLEVGAISVADCDERCWLQGKYFLEPANPVSLSPTDAYPLVRAGAVTVLSSQQRPEKSFVRGEILY